jgi:hypothetical protein
VPSLRELAELRPVISRGSLIAGVFIVGQVLSAIFILSHPVRAILLVLEMGVLRKFSRYITSQLGFRLLESYATSLSFVISGNNLYAYPKHRVSEPKHALTMVFIPDDGAAIQYATIHALLDVYWKYNIVLASKKRDHQLIKRLTEDERPEQLDRIGFCFALECARIWCETPVSEPILLPPVCDCPPEWKKGSIKTHARGWVNGLRKEKGSEIMMMSIPPHLSEGFDAYGEFFNPEVADLLDRDLGDRLRTRSAPCLTSCGCLTPYHNCN